MKKTLRHKAYEKIKNMIIFLDLKPGQKIVESEIAEKLKIGRTPVREALLMLENEKLVACGIKKGFVVRPLSSREIEEYFGLLVHMEDFAIPMIIERITPSELKELENNIRKTEAAVKSASLREIIRYETQFHKILYRATKSETFIDTISYLVDRFQWLRAIALSAEQGLQESIRDHKETYKYIVNKDSKRTKKIMREHIYRAKEKVSLVQAILL